MIMYKIRYYTFGENISLNTSAYLGFENFCPANIFSSMVSDIIARILTLCFSSFKINVFCHIMCVCRKKTLLYLMTMVKTSPVWKLCRGGMKDSRYICYKQCLNNMICFISLSSYIPPNVLAWSSCLKEQSKSAFRWVQATLWHVPWVQFPRQGQRERCSLCLGETNGEV